MKGNHQPSGCSSAAWGLVAGETGKLLLRSEAVNQGQEVMTSSGCIMYMNLRSVSLNHEATTEDEPHPQASSTISHVMQPGLNSNQMLLLTKKKL